MKYLVLLLTFIITFGVLADDKEAQAQVAQRQVEINEKELDPFHNFNKSKNRHDRLEAEKYMRELLGVEPGSNERSAGTQ